MTEPWIITCETCQTKLRVRSAEAIGSILACPKCQSLVRVVAPEDPAETSPPAAVGPDDAEAGSWSGLPVRLALAGVGLSVVVVAGLLVAQRTGSDGIAESADAAAVGDRDASGDLEAPSAADQARAPEAAATTESSAQADNEPTVAPGDLPEGAANGAPAEAAPPPLPELPATASQRQPPATRSDPSADRPAGREIPRIGLSQFDLDFSAEQPPLADRSTSATGRTESDGAPQADAPADSEPAPERATSSIVRMAVARVDAAESPQSPSNPGQALSLPLISLTVAEAQQWSPVEFVRLIAEMTGATITFTPEAYLAARHAPGGAAGGDYAGATAGEVLAAILTRHGLAISQRAHHLVILPLDRSAERRSVVRDADDLPPNGPLAVKLRQHVTFSFTRAAALAEVLRHIERAAGLTLLVDWESLATVGLSPTSQVTASAVDQPLADVLDGLLPQLEMGWAVVGEDALWLSARDHGA